MICQRCGKNPVSVHLAQVVNGERQDLHLCKECAMEKGLGIPDKAIGDLLRGLIGDAYKTRAASGIDTCPQCGYALVSFQKNGLMGCAHCYEHFAQWADPVIRRVQGGNQTHKGRRPPEQPGEPANRQESTPEYAPQERKQQLQEKMQQAVRDEAYEEAARLRDEIRAIDQETSSQQREVST